MRVTNQIFDVKKRDRESLKGHQGKVIWFTGLSGSGKSTVANGLDKALHNKGLHTYVLDGDNIRQGLNKDLGFSDADRIENIRRVAEVSRLMMDAGLIVITAFISPFRQDRQMAKDLIGPANFVEVYMSTPLKICEERDLKGLYKRARFGEIQHMTGISSPYEPPLEPDVEICGHDTTVQSEVQMLLDFIKAKFKTTHLVNNDANLDIGPQQAS